MRWLIPALLFPLTACYSYVPIGDATPEPGATVRAHLSETGANEMTAALGPRAEIAQGTLLRLDGQEIVLAVEEVVTTTGISNPWNRETIAFPATAISRMEGKKFSRSRTLVFTGGLLVAGLVARKFIDKSLTGGSSDEPPTPGPGQGHVD